MISRSNIGDNVILRPICCNIATEKVDYQSLINQVVRLGDAIMAENNSE